MITKKCNTCFCEKNVTDFSNHPSNKDGLRKTCKKCRSLQQSTRYANNPNKARESSLKRLYGVTSEKYDEIMEQQKSVCAICHRPDKNKQLSVDHCHSTGFVRGLLCTSCNLTLGHAQDSPDRLRQAALYLERFFNETYV